MSSRSLLAPVCSVALLAATMFVGCRANQYGGFAGDSYWSGYASPEQGMAACPQCGKYHGPSSESGDFAGALPQPSEAGAYYDGQPVPRERPLRVPPADPTLRGPNGDSPRPDVPLPSENGSGTAWYDDYGSAGRPTPLRPVPDRGRDWSQSPFVAEPAETQRRFLPQGEPGEPNLFQRIGDGLKRMVRPAAGFEGTFGLRAPESPARPTFEQPPRPSPFRRLPLPRSDAWEQVARRPAISFDRSDSVALEGAEFWERIYAEAQVAAGHTAGSTAGASTAVSADIEDFGRAERSDYQQTTVGDTPGRQDRVPRQATPSSNRGALMQVPASESLFERQPFTPQPFEERESRPATAPPAERPGDSWSHPLFEDGDAEIADEARTLVIQPGPRRTSVPPALLPVP